jgi:aryl-alcohol dehydrogenase-like predicted oxidoreductase
MVAALALGCMNFGKRTPADESLRIIARAVDAGIDVLDTANVYNDGESERLVARALAALPPSARQRVKVHTKCGFARVDGKPEGLSAAAIARAIDGSLSRLGVERLDVLYLHVPDHATPIDESIGAIAAAQKAGKVAALGVSNYAAWEILEMFGLCDAAGASRPVISQVLYNVLVRQVEIEYLRFTSKFHVHTTVYNPLAGGLLARPAPSAAAAPPPGSRFATNKMYVKRYWTDAMHAAAASLAEAAAAHGKTSIELAYGWLRDRPGVDSVIIGPASEAHLADALAAWRAPLPPELVARADEIHAELAGTDARYAR